MSENEKVRYVCIGLRLFKGDKARSAFQRLDDAGKIVHADNVSAWDKVNGDPGLIYEAEITPDGKITGRPGRWLVVVGSWPDRAEVSEWRALGRAASAEHGKANARAKIARDAKAEAELSGLRSAYQATGWAMRSAFLAAVIEEITRR